MDKTIPIENGIVETVVEPVKMISSFDVAGVSLWNFIVILIFLVCCYLLLRPVRRYAEQRLRNKYASTANRSVLYALASAQGWIVLLLLAVAAYGTAFFIDGVVDAIVRATIVLCIVLFARMPYWLIDRYFISLSAGVWGPRKYNYDILASVLKYVVTFFFVLAVLNVFRLGLRDILDINIPAEVAAIMSAVVFIPILQFLVSAWALTFTHPFVRDDYVKIGDDVGTVVHSAIGSTTLLGSSDELIIVPHKGLGTKTIINYSTRKKLRVDWTFRLALDVATDKLELLATRVESLINTRADCKLIGCRYDDGVMGAYVLKLLFNVEIPPSHIVEVEHVKNTVYSDISRIVDEVGMSFARPMIAA